MKHFVFKKESEEAETRTKDEEPDIAPENCQDLSLSPVHSSRPPVPIRSRPPPVPAPDLPLSRSAPALPLSQSVPDLPLSWSIPDLPLSQFEPSPCPGPPRPPPVPVLSSPPPVSAPALSLSWSSRPPPVPVRSSPPLPLSVPGLTLFLGCRTCGHFRSLGCQNCGYLRGGGSGFGTVRLLSGFESVFLLLSVFVLSCVILSFPGYLFYPCILS